MRPEHKKVPAMPPGPHAEGSCRAVASVLARVGDKWSVLVIMMLIDGPMRFNELKRKIGGISQRMLTLTLRGLERDGLVTRTIFRPSRRGSTTNSLISAAGWRSRCRRSANGRSSTCRRSRARGRVSTPRNEKS